MVNIHLPRTKYVKPIYFFIYYRIIGLLGKGQAVDVLYFDFSRRNYCRWIENCSKTIIVLFICHCQKEACIKNVLIKFG